MAKKEFWECDICGGEYENKEAVAHEISLKNEELNVWNDVCETCFTRIKSAINNLKKSK